MKIDKHLEKSNTIPPPTLTQILSPVDRIVRALPMVDRMIRTLSKVLSECRPSTFEYITIGSLKTLLKGVCLVLILSGMQAAYCGGRESEGKREWVSDGEGESVGEGRR